MHRVISIVVTYHPAPCAFEALRLLAGQTDHVIVVDNSADAEDRARLMRECGSDPARFTLLFNPANLGVGAALNRGFREAAQRGAEWVLTMDQDSRITAGMVRALFAVYDALPAPDRSRVASLAPALVPEAPARAGLANEQPPYREVATAITSGNLVRVSAWQAVRGYEEKLFIDYVDHDFCFRLRQAGWTVLECAGAHLIHSIGNATRIRLFGRAVTINQHPPLRAYYIMRNGCYFWSRFPEPCAFTRSDKLNTLTLFLKALLVDTHKRARLKMFWRGYRDYRKRRFGSYAEHHPA